jgi:hypothetical protein
MPTPYVDHLSPSLVHNRRMRLGRITALVLAGALAMGAPAHAAEPTPTTLGLSAPRAFAGDGTPVTITLVEGEGTPVAGEPVVLERLVDGEWSEVTTLVTDEEGDATSDQTLAKDASDNRFRATYAGDETRAASRTGPVQVELRRRASRVRIDAPDEVVDEKRVVLRVVWETGNGLPVRGRVKLLLRKPGKKWRTFKRLDTGPEGAARVKVRPRVDTRWKVRTRRLDWVEKDRSPVHRIDNVPPGEPVRLPRHAPRPRVDLPDQRRAAGKGANPRVTRIPNGVWNQMTGRSWHRGCPVGRGQLRLLRVNYWAYDGYRRRGELVAHADAIGNMRGALVAMYARKLPIRSMYRVDRFGWSGRLQGANDYRSMAAGNTSAFNCRQVVNRPGVRSPHSYGRSLDINTWENPYRSPTGLVPNSWWQRRSHPLVAWRSRAHPVVRIMARHGLRWTYGMGDTQHFDATGAHGRVMVYPGCEDVVCD